MLVKVLLVLAAIIAAFLIVVATRPADFRVERSIAIAAAPDAVFPHLNNLRAAHAWSPWVKMDPDAAFAFEGPAEGVGAASTWSGARTGAGRQTIVESRTNERVRMRLDFERPFATTNEAEFRLRRDETRGVTFVTWSLSGRNNFVAKAMCLLLNQDKMVGGPFETGLADLKALVEGALSVNPTQPQPR